MKASFSDFDLRQLQQMRLLVVRVQEGQLPLHQFITDQWALLEMLESVQSDWKDAYLSEVNSIEDIYASMLEQGRKSLDSNEKKSVDRAIGEMLTLLISPLSEVEN